MLSILDFARVKRLLCLGAHCDDIEIGAGGTILSLAKSCPHLEVRWAVFTGEDPTRVEEAQRAAEVFLAGIANSKVTIYGFRDGFMPFQGELIKETFEELKSSFKPDLILTHHDGDRHQDHRFVSQLTWNTWRDHMILEYEIMKYDGDLGRPNLFVPLSEEVCRDKIAGLFASFPSQFSRQWFNEEAFWSLLRLRGIECNAPSRFAEAFFVRKIVAGLDPRRNTAALSLVAFNKQGVPREGVTREPAGALTLAVPTRSSILPFCIQPCETSPAC